MALADFRALALGSLCAGLLALGAAPAKADQYIFGFTPSGKQRLDLEISGGLVPVTATSTGWYDSTGFHSTLFLNNYLVGDAGGTSYRDFFVFDLSGVTGTITSAALDVGNVTGAFDASPTSTVTLYDVSTAISDLTADQTGATSTYTDLGTGTEYGSLVVSAADNYSQVVIPLDSDALAALNAAEGQQFAIGGALTYTPVSVPEPATLALLGAGLVGLGMLRRRRA